MSMRRWDEEPQDAPSLQSVGPYEAVGYVLYGRAELYIEGQLIHLREGDSWVVPKGAQHQYRVLERFGAIEATSPPSHIKDRDADLGRPSQPAE